MSKYKKAFNTLDNLYNTLFCEYQSLINEYNLDFKEKALNEIDEVYKSMINKQQNKTKRSNKNEK